MSTQEIRRECKDRGLDWRAVRAAYQMEKAEEWEKRERPNEIRATAWQLYTAQTPGCWEFWRHGFRSRFERRLANGADHTIIPGYDEIAQSIASQFPEYDTDDGTDRLWDFLLSAYDRYPSTETLYRRAMDRVEAAGRDLEPVPF